MSISPLINKQQTKIASGRLSVSIYDLIDLVIHSTI